MAHTRAERIEAFGRLLDTLDILRVECPWDRKQTNESLRPNTIEEVYELSSALSHNNTDEIRKELGDVLLHVLFYSKIADEKGEFDIADVADSLNNKLIFRHPHVFGTAEAKDAQQVSENWEQIKLKEKGGNKTVLGGVPETLPALIKAYRIQEKASNVGFDWAKPQDVWNKVKEEIAEFEHELDKNDSKSMTCEMGDLLFSIINVARLYGIHPDSALDKTNDKFIRRFNYIEEQARLNGKALKEMSLSEMEELWNEAKNQEHC